MPEKPSISPAFSARSLSFRAIKKAKVRRCSGPIQHTVPSHIVNPYSVRSKSSVNRTRSSSRSSVPSTKRVPNYRSSTSVTSASSLRLLNRNVNAGNSSTPSVTSSSSRKGTSSKTPHIADEPKIRTTLEPLTQGPAGSAENENIPTPAMTTMTVLPKGNNPSSGQELNKTIGKSLTDRSPSREFDEAHGQERRSASKHRSSRLTKHMNKGIVEDHISEQSVEKDLMVSSSAEQLVNKTPEFEQIEEIKEGTENSIDTAELPPNGPELFVEENLEDSELGKTRSSRKGHRSSSTSLMRPHNGKSSAILAGRSGIESTVTPDERLAEEDEESMAEDYADQVIASSMALIDTYDLGDGEVGKAPLLEEELVVPSIVAVNEPTVDKTDLKNKTEDDDSAEDFLKKINEIRPDLSPVSDSPRTSRALIGRESHEMKPSIEMTGAGVLEAWPTPVDSRRPSTVAVTMPQLEENNTEESAEAVIYSSRQSSEASGFASLGLERAPVISVSQNRAVSPYANNGKKNQPNPSTTNSSPALEKPNVPQPLDKPKPSQPLDRPKSSRPLDKPKISRPLDKPEIPRPTENSIPLRPLSKPETPRPLDKPAPSQPLALQELPKPTHTSNSKSARGIKRNTSTNATEEMGEKPLDNKMTVEVVEVNVRTVDEEAPMKPGPSELGLGRDSKTLAKSSIGPQTHPQGSLQQTAKDNAFRDVSMVEKLETLSQLIGKSDVQSLAGNFTSDKSLTREDIERLLNYKDAIPDGVHIHVHLHRASAPDSQVEQPLTELPPRDQTETKKSISPKTLTLQCQTVSDSKPTIVERQSIVSSKPASTTRKVYRPNCPAARPQSVQLPPWSLFVQEDRECERQFKESLLTESDHSECEAHRYMHDCSTVSPSNDFDCLEEYRSRFVEYVDAPLKRDISCDSAHESLDEPSPGFLHTCGSEFNHLTAGSVKDEDLDSAGNYPEDQVIDSTSEAPNPVAEAVVIPETTYPLGVDDPTSSLSKKKRKNKCPTSEDPMMTAYLKSDGKPYMSLLWDILETEKNEIYLQGKHIAESLGFFNRVKNLTQTMSPLDRYVFANMYEYRLNEMELEDNDSVSLPSLFLNYMVDPFSDLMDKVKQAKQDRFLLKKSCSWLTKFRLVPECICSNFNLVLRREKSEPSSQLINDEPSSTSGGSEAVSSAGS